MPSINFASLKDLQEIEKPEIFVERDN